MLIAFYSHITSQNWSKNERATPTGSKITPLALDAKGCKNRKKENIHPIKILIYFFFGGGKHCLLCFRFVFFFFLYVYSMPHSRPHYQISIMYRVCLLGGTPESFTVQLDQEDLIQELKDQESRFVFCRIKRYASSRRPSQNTLSIRLHDRDESQ